MENEPIIFQEDHIDIKKAKPDDEIVEDSLDEYIWDGPADSDEEIAEMVKYKNEYEKSIDLKFSKNGLVNHIENYLSNDC